MTRRARESVAVGPKEGDDMKHRLRITIAVLHISAFVNVVLALGLLAVGGGDPDLARVLGPAPA